MIHALTSIAAFTPGSERDGIVVGSIRRGSAAANERVRVWILDGLADSLPSLRIRALFECRPDLLTAAEVSILAVTARDERVVGILTASDVTTRDGADFLHIPIQMIGERYQRSLLLKRMWRVLLRDCVSRTGTLPDLFVLRTCNPSAFAAMHAFTRLAGVTMYPDIAHPSEDHALHATACAVADRLNPSARFDPRTGVLHDIGRPADLYPEVPAGRREVLDRYFRSHLTPSDRLLCLLRLETEAAKRRVLRAVGASEAPAPAGALGSSGDVARLRRNVRPADHRESNPRSAP